MKLKEYLQRKKARKYFLKEDRWMDYYYRSSKLDDIPYILGISYSIVHHEYSKIIEKYRGNIIQDYFSDIQKDTLNYQTEAINQINKLFRDDSKYILKIVKRNVDD